MSTTITKKYVRKRVSFPIERMPEQEQKKSFVQRLQLYIEKENAGENHFKWVALTMVTQAIIITPVIASVIIMTGNWIPLWFVAAATMFVTFIPSLSGLSVKRIMAVYLINQIISVLIIATAILHFIIITPD